MRGTFRAGFRVLSTVAVALGLVWMVLGLRGLQAQEPRSGLLVSFGGTAATIGLLTWWWFGRGSD